MICFFRRRSAEAGAIAGLLFGHVEEQLHASGQLRGPAVPPVAMSFWLHDYMMGLITGADRAGRLRAADGREAFVRFMMTALHLKQASARSCYATSRSHCRSNPREAAFLRGLEDAEALLSGGAARQSLLAQFGAPQELW